METSAQPDLKTPLSRSEISFIDEKAVSERLSIPIATLQRWRWLGTGPKYHKFGRLVRYALSDIEDFVRNSIQSGELN